MGLLFTLYEMGQNCFPSFIVSGCLSLWFLKSDEKNSPNKKPHTFRSSPNFPFPLPLHSFLSPYQTESTSSSITFVGGFLGKSFGLLALT